MLCLKTAGGKIGIQKGDALCLKYVDDARQLEEAVGGGAKVLAEKKYCKYISRKGIGFVTRVSMNVSDRPSMAKMVHPAL